MKLRNSAAILMLALCGLTVDGQDTWYGTMSGIHFMYNPAFTGYAGVPRADISCYSFLPGNNFGLRSVYASFNDYVTVLHGGAGLWLADDILGEIMNDFRAGACYSYHLRAGKDLFFNAGLTASLVHRGIKRGSITLPDDIDPLSGMMGSSEYITAGDITLFDIGTGITFARGPWYGGLSVMHLTQPWLSDQQEGHNRLRRMYTVNAGTSLSPGEGRITLNPSAAFLAQADNLTFYLGTEVLYRDLMCGMALWQIISGFTVMEPSLGWDTGIAKIILSYSYVLAGGDTAFKGTAVVKAGISFCFNKVEKRRVIHIIKLPCL
jgi:type IX secretion system PorP/SprF family membrane protein